MVETESEAFRPKTPRSSNKRSTSSAFSFATPLSSDRIGNVVGGGLRDWGLGDLDMPVEYPPLEGRVELLEEVDTPDD